MTDVHLSPSPDHTSPNPTAAGPTASGLGWPTTTTTSIDVSRETSMTPAGLGWPE
jgi:hypothetical protein